MRVPMRITGADQLVVVVKSLARSIYKIDWMRGAG
jgi:hypothetical protein